MNKRRRKSCKNLFYFFLHFPFISIFFGVLAIQEEKKLESHIEPKKKGKKKKRKKKKKKEEKRRKGGRSSKGALDPRPPELRLHGGQAGLEVADGVLVSLVLGGKAVNLVLELLNKDIFATAGPDGSEPVLDPLPLQPEVLNSLVIELHGPGAAVELFHGRSDEFLAEFLIKGNSPIKFGDEEFQLALPARVHSATLGLVLQKGGGGSQSRGLHIPHGLTVGGRGALLSVKRGLRVQGGGRVGLGAGEEIVKGHGNDDVVKLEGLLHIKEAG